MKVKPLPVDFRLVTSRKGPLIVFAVYRCPLGQAPQWITWTGVLN